MIIRKDALREYIRGCSLGLTQFAEFGTWNGSTSVGRGRLSIKVEYEPTHEADGIADIVAILADTLGLKTSIVQASGNHTEEPQDGPYSQSTGSPTNASGQEVPDDEPNCNVHDRYEAREYSVARFDVLLTSLLTRINVLSCDQGNTKKWD